MYVVLNSSSLVVMTDFVPTAITLSTASTVSTLGSFSVTSPVSALKLYVRVVVSKPFLPSVLVSCFLASSSLSSTYLVLNSSSLVVTTGLVPTAMTLSTLVVTISLTIVGSPTRLPDCVTYVLVVFNLPTTPSTSTLCFPCSRFLSSL